MICSDIWHKYCKQYFKTVIHNEDNFEMSPVVFMPNITTNHDIIRLYYYLRSSVM